MTLYESERAYRSRVIREALTKHQGNRTRTAKALGLSRRHLLRVIQDLGLAPAGVEPVDETETVGGP